MVWACSLSCQKASYTKEAYRKRSSFSMVALMFIVISLFTALTSIDFAFKAGFLDVSGVEVFMAGQDKIPDIKLTSGVKITNLGKMSMEKYIEFDKSIDLAVSHDGSPSKLSNAWICLIGTSVVTTKYGNKQDLKNTQKYCYIRHRCWIYRRRN